MSYPDICDQIRESAQSSQRTGPIVRTIWHHQASTNDDATIAMMVNETRQVSANQTVDNKPPAWAPTRSWARITGVVPTERRAWTSSSARADGQAMTREVANSTGAPGWGISDATFEACARLAVWDYLNLGIPLKRATRADPTGHLGHNEVLGMFDQGYVTSCPLNLYVDRILDEARALLASTAGLEVTPIESEEDDMSKTIRIRTENEDGTQQWGLVLDGPTFVPLWYPESANALAEDLGDFPLVHPTDFREIAHACGYVFEDEKPEGEGREGA